MQHQGKHFALQAARIVGNTADAFDVHPFGVAEIRRQNEDNELAFIDPFFERPDPVVTPANGFLVEETADAIPSQAAIEFFDELFVLAAVTEKDVVGGRGHGDHLTVRRCDSIKAAKGREPLPFVICSAAEE